MTRADYVNNRNRAIAYGTWEPFVSAKPSREHVQRLRTLGASYEAIALASGLPRMTIYSLTLDLVKWVRPETERKLLAVTGETLQLTRTHATGTRLRSRSLVAMGHSVTRQARALDTPADTLIGIVKGDVPTVAVELRDDVIRLWDAWWDKVPPETTKGERVAASMARGRAEREDWCCPLALDENRIDDPGYEPRSGWHPATGAGIADDYPLSRSREPGKHVTAIRDLIALHLARELAERIESAL